MVAEPEVVDEQPSSIAETKGLSYRMNVLTTDDDGVDSDIEDLLETRWT